MELEQRRSRLTDQQPESCVDGRHLRIDMFDPSSEATHRQQSGVADRVRTRTRPELGDFSDEPGLGSVLEPAPDRLRSREHQMPQLVEGLDACLSWLRVWMHASAG